MKEFSDLLLSFKLEPPSFVKKIENVSAIVGNNVSLQAILKGSEVITVTWMKGRDVVREDNKVKITFDNNIATLHISSVQVNSAGKYTCVAENDAGSQSCFGELLVKGQLVIPLLYLSDQQLFPIS